MSHIDRKILFALFAAALSVGTAAWADPPDRVGRLNLIEGEVCFQSGGWSGWSPATMNYPLTVGDSLWTGESSRAEAHVGSTAIRLGPWSEVDFQELNDAAVRLRLPQGLLHVRLRQLEPGESFEIRTPTANARLRVPGSFRIEVSDQGDTRLTVHEGSLEVLAAGRSCLLRAQQTATVARSDASSVQIRRARAEDEWDCWCAQRDRREDRLVSAQYVPRTLLGCEDLDWYGTWSVHVEYGPVWTPSSLPAGWEPYRNGRWVWVEPWGWTWVDDAPWGFAPFHYGRWVRVRGVWVWVPGTIARRPVYAPALTVFNGDRPSRPTVQPRPTPRPTPQPQVRNSARERDNAPKGSPNKAKVQVRKRKKLANGLWVWLEEWLEE